MKLGKINLSITKYKDTIFTVFGLILTLIGLKLGCDSNELSKKAIKIAENDSLISAQLKATSQILEKQDSQLQQLLTLNENAQEQLSRINLQTTILNSSFNLTKEKYKSEDFSNFNSFRKAIIEYFSIFPNGLKKFKQLCFLDARSKATEIINLDKKIDNSFLQKYSNLSDKWNDIKYYYKLTFGPPNDHYISPVDFSEGCDDSKYELYLIDRKNHLIDLFYEFLDMSVDVIDPQGIRLNGGRIK